jgi:cytochrome c oxidase subunit 4
MTEDHSGQHRAPYFAIFVVLCVLTAMSVIFDVVNLRGQTVLGMNGTVLLTFLVLAVASAKALCVMAFFMHLKWEGNWKFLLLAPTTILAMGIPLALLPDIGVHYYPVDVPQVHYEIDDAAAHGGEAPAAEEPTAGHDH